MSIRQTIKLIASDFNNHGGKSFAKCCYVYLFDAKFRLLLNYRLGRYFEHSKFKPFKLLSARYKYRQITKRGCQVSFKADIGAGVKFLHPIGVVIGDDVVIGNNVSIWQQVTLGSHGRPGEALNYPVVQDNVKIFAGAKLFGSITIGSNAIIGANAVVNKNVPANTTAVGIPATIK